MKKQPLSKTNPYLLDHQKRLAGMVISVSSSSAIEGIAARDLLEKHIQRKTEETVSRHPVTSEQSHR